MTDRDLAAFEHWWYVLGSGYRPMPDEDQEEHAHRVARLAWLACASQVIHLQLPPSDPTPHPSRHDLHT